MQLSLKNHILFRYIFVPRPTCALPYPKEIGNQVAKVDGSNEYTPQLMTF